MSFDNLDNDRLQLLINEFADSPPESSMKKLAIKCRSCRRPEDLFDLSIKLDTQLHPDRRRELRALVEARI